MSTDQKLKPAEETLFTTANRELGLAWRRLPVSWMLALLSIKHRYERSLLGPFWITLTQAVYIAVIAFVFGTIFKSDAAQFVPFVTGGILIITWISTTLQDSSSVLIDRAYKIQDGDRFVLGHVCEVVFRNLLILGHHFVILLLVLWYYRAPLEPLDFLAAILGAGVISLNLVGFGMLLSLLSLRYRDFGPLIASVLKILFIITPVMWKPALLGDYEYLVDWNPVSHWINLIRDPLMHSTYRFDSLGISLATAVVGLVSGYFAFVLSHRKLTLWL